MNFSVVHHISINVADTDAARSFYVGSLGFEEIDRPDLGFNGAWLQIGDQQLHLLEVENHDAPVGQHFAFQVDDIHQYRSHLVDQGVKVSDPSELGGVCLQCFFKDPSGNLLELNQPL
jgi:glyoxylase I family protein